MNSRVLSQFLDADGCIYNDKYRLLLCHIIIKFGPQIRKINDRLFDEKTREKIQEIIEEIKREIATIDLSKLDPDLPHILMENYRKVAFSRRAYMEAMAEYQKKILFGKEHEERFYQNTYAKALNSSIAFFDSIDTAVMDGIVCRANEVFFKRLYNRCVSEQVTTAVFVDVSLRQSYGVELVNAISNGTRLFVRDIQVLAKWFASMVANLGIDVIVEKITLSDPCNNLEPGTSFDLMMHQNANTISHPQALGDTSKFSILVNVSHFLAIKYKDAYNKGNLLADYLDDRIIKELEDAINNRGGSRLLPFNINAVHYVGDDINESEIRLINGVGKPNPFFGALIRRMFSFCGVPMQDGKVKDPKSFEKSYNVAQQVDLGILHGIHQMYLHPFNHLSSFGFGAGVATLRILGLGRNNNHQPKGVGDSFKSSSEKPGFN